MPQICFERIIPGDYNPARAEGQRAAAQQFRAQVQASVKKGSAPDAMSLPTLHTEDPQHPVIVARMALIAVKQWENGKTLNCTFLDGDPAWRDKVVQKAKIWEQYANIHLNFTDNRDAEIRISFSADAGSWSAVGTDALVEKYFPKYQPTMNFGWLRGDTPDTEYERVAVHEFGHALGCIHEHQSPAVNLQWDVPAAYRYFSGPPNYWKKDEIDQNVLEKYSQEGIVNTPFDDNSIMLYQFPAELFTNHQPTPLNTQLSQTDKQMIARMYPK